jgi:hypothetical protein
VIDHQGQAVVQEWMVAHYEVLKDFAGPAITFLGFVATLGLGVTGFKRWRRQEVEGRRIDTAIKALSIAYESKFVFDTIRSPMSFDYEWKDMPETPGETDAQRRQRGTFYAVGKRISQHKDFFERVYKLQPRCMAMFGREAEEIFMLMHKSRREIEVSSQMLAWKVGQYEDHEAPDHNQAFYEQCRRDIWNVGEFQPDKDKVGKQLVKFRERMENTFRPVLGRNFKGAAEPKKRWWKRRPGEA